MPYPRSATTDGEIWTDLTSITPPTEGVFDFYLDAVGGDDANDGESVGNPILTAGRMKQIYDYIRWVNRSFEVIVFNITGQMGVSDTDTASVLDFAALDWRDFVNVQFLGTSEIQAVDPDNAGVALGTVAMTFASGTTWDMGLVGTVTAGFVGGWTANTSLRDGYLLILDGKTLSDSSGVVSIDAAKGVDSFWVSGQNTSTDLPKPANGNYRIIKFGVSILLPPSEPPRLTTEGLVLKGLDIIVSGLTSGFHIDAGSLTIQRCHFKGRLQLKSGSLNSQATKFSLYNHTFIESSANWQLNNCCIDFQGNTTKRLSVQRGGTIDVGSTCVIRDCGEFRIDGGHWTSYNSPTLCLRNCAGIGSDQKTFASLAYNQGSIDSIRLLGELEVGETNAIMARGLFSAYWRADNDIRQNGGITQAEVSMDGGASHVAENPDTGARVYGYPQTVGATTTTASGTATIPAAASSVALTFDGTLLDGRPVLATLMTNDATLTKVVATWNGAGVLTLTGEAAATGAVTVAWEIK